MRLLEVLRANNIIEIGAYTMLSRHKAKEQVNPGKFMKCWMRYLEIIRKFALIDVWVFAMRSKITLQIISPRG